MVAVAHGRDGMEAYIEALYPLHRGGWKLPMFRAIHQPYVMRNVWFRPPATLFFQDWS